MLMQIIQFYYKSSILVICLRFNVQLIYIVYTIYNFKILKYLKQLEQQIPIKKHIMIKTIHFSLHLKFKIL
jgi:hypothetical protein